MVLREGAWIDVDRPGEECDFVARLLVFMAVFNVEDRIGKERGLGTAVSGLILTN